MALSTITGISTVSATEAEQRALDCYNARYGGCPDGLVSKHSTITYAFTPTYGAVTYYSEIVPTGNQGVWVYASGLTQDAAINSWENQIASGGFNGNSLGQNCQVCTQGVTHHNYTYNPYGSDELSGHNFDTLTNAVGQSINVEYQLEVHNVSASGYSSTGDIGTIVSQTITAADPGGAAGDPAGITNVCGWSYSSTSISLYSSFTYSDYGWWANDNYLGKTYIRKNSSDQWVYEANPLLEDGIPIDSAIHDHDHIYTAAEAAAAGGGAVTSGFKQTLITTSEYHPVVYNGGLDPSLAHIEIPLNQSAGSTSSNLIVPNSVDITGLTTAQTLIIGAEHVASDTVSTYPDQNQDYCDYAGNSRTSVLFYRISDVEITINTCNGAAVDSNAGSDIHDTRLCSGDIWQVSGIINATTDCNITTCANLTSQASQSQTSSSESSRCSPTPPACPSNLAGQTAIWGANDCATASQAECCPPECDPTVSSTNRIFVTNAIGCDGKEAYTVIVDASSVTPRAPNAMEQRYANLFWPRNPALYGDECVGEMLLIDGLPWYVPAAAAKLRSYSNCGPWSFTDDVYGTTVTAPAFGAMPFTVEVCAFDATSTQGGVSSVIAASSTSPGSNCHDFYCIRSVTVTVNCSTNQVTTNETATDCQLSASVLAGTVNASSYGVTAFNEWQCQGKVGDVITYKAAIIDGVCQGSPCGCASAPAIPHAQLFLNWYNGGRNTQSSCICPQHNPSPSSSAAPSSSTATTSSTTTSPSGPWHSPASSDISVASGPSCSSHPGPCETVATYRGTYFEYYFGLWRARPTVFQACDLRKHNGVCYVALQTHSLAWGDTRSNRARCRIELDCLLGCKTMPRDSFCLF